MSTRTRDRRGRGIRGPAILPTTLGQPAGPSRRERFDRMVLAEVAALDQRWKSHLGLVEYAVEDFPLLPADWRDDVVPLSSVVPGSGSTPTRLVVFRRPIELRSGSLQEQRALILAVLIEQLADVLGLDPQQVDPRYEG